MLLSGTLFGTKRRAAHGAPQLDVLPGGGTSDAMVTPRGSHLGDEGLSNRHEVITRRRRRRRRRRRCCCLAKKKPGKTVK